MHWNTPCKCRLYAQQMTFTIHLLPCQTECQFVHPYSNHHRNGCPPGNLTKWCMEQGCLRVYRARKSTMKPRTCSYITPHPPKKGRSRARTFPATHPIMYRWRQQLLVMLCFLEDVQVLIWRGNLFAGLSAHLCKHTPRTEDARYALYKRRLSSGKKMALNHRLVTSRKWLVPRLPLAGNMVSVCVQTIKFGDRIQIHWLCLNLQVKHQQHRPTSVWEAGAVFSRQWNNAKRKMIYQKDS